MAVRFNINDYWRFHLAPEGVKILDAHDATMNETYPGVNFNWRKLYKLDHDGKIVMQGWAVMKFFGPHTFLGGPILIGTEIEFV